MIDTNTYGLADLTYKDYERIEILVVNLYEELNVGDFPIDPFLLAKQKGYVLLPFSKIKKEAREQMRKKEIAGASVRTKEGVRRIFYDDLHPRNRQRFTIMHEMGHIQLGHKENSMYAERCANYFATYSFAPTPIIGLYGCEDYIEVSKRFKLSQESALYAFDRYKRWVNIPCALKPYEKKLNMLFDKKL